MKSFVVRPIGLVGVLLMAAGCGSSNDTGTPVVGGPDGSVDATAPDTDGQVNTPDTGGGGSDAPATDDAGSCGDGILSGTEQCDDGAKNGTAGDGCSYGCAFVCVPGDPTLGDPACNTSGNVCLGTATCQADHTCKPGTPLANGASCGTGEICTNGVCAPTVCGDGIVSSPEECDDGANNGTASDGCTKTCTFVCVSSDPKRNCTPVDPCAGKGTCNDTTHVCTAGTAEGDGTICGGEAADGGAPDGGPIDVCKGGTCVSGYCGDGVLEAGEQCDFGAGNGAGTGCEATCKFSCTTSPNSCPQPSDICAGTNACTSVVVNGDTGQHCVQGSPLANNTTCPGGTCQGGKCNIATCGNGTLQTGEQCDFGAGKNLAGSGCEPDCQFSCQKTPTDTCQTNTCAANPTVCTTVAASAGGTAGQKCNATTQLASCGDCSASGVCVSNQCATSHCGDGCVDSRIGETCEPPNSATCDASCHTIAAAVCGNGKLEAGEQCDDGNKVNLDGCSYSTLPGVPQCQFEQSQRATLVTINGGTDSFCAANALGSKALGGNGSLAIGQLNSTLATGVGNGSTTIAFEFVGIGDLTGQSASPNLKLGALSGAPVTGTGYSGTADNDWWYTTTADTIDSSRLPKSLLPATLSGTKLAASGTIDLAVALTGAVTTLHSTSTKIAASAGAATAPTKSTGATPGHLASENIDPTLVSFDTMSSGQLCGNISTYSLSTVPVPTILQNSLLCGFAAYKSLLDVLVDGCGTLISATQPDQIDPSAPAAGAGAPYTLVLTGATVTGCKDKAGTLFANPSAGFTACINAAAYSSYFNFTSDRVIMK